MPSTIVQRLLQQHRIVRVDVVPDDVKLKIYILALREIKNLVTKRKTRLIPRVSLVAYEDALQEIIYAFYELRYQKIGKEFRLEEDVIPTVKSALAHISAALDLEKKGVDYFQYTIEFVDKVFELCSYFVVDSDGNVL